MDQLDGSFDVILAITPDLGAIAVELADLRAQGWVNADGAARVNSSCVHPP